MRRLAAIRLRQDTAAGAVTVMAGGVAAFEGWLDDIGSVSEMGPGFFPFVLGIIMVGLGVMIAVSSAPASHQGDPAMPALDRRGAACIIGGMLLFLVVVQHGGLLPAAFLATFVAAWADREATLLGSVGIALLAALIGLLLFHEALKLPLPLFRWG